jgi:hypothetical protein
LFLKQDKMRWTIVTFCGMVKREMEKAGRDKSMTNMVRRERNEQSVFQRCHWKGADSGKQLTTGQETAYCKLAELKRSSQGKVSRSRDRF